MPPKLESFSSVAAQPNKKMESAKPDVNVLGSLEGVEDALIAPQRLKALIRERIELKGEAVATPKLVRRYIEQQQHLKIGTLDPIRKLVNKLTKEVLSEGSRTEVEELAPTKTGRSGRAKKAKPVGKRAQRRSLSPVRKTSSPYYTMLRRLCFASSINCNRLGLGGKNLVQKLRIIKTALAEKGFDSSQLNSQNLSETLEMAEIEKDRKELQEASARVSGRRARSTESYTEFFSGSEQDVASDDEDTTGDADDESDDVSSFEVESDMDEDSDQNENSDYYQELKENLQPKKRQSTTKKSASKKRAKKAKLVASEDVEMQSGSDSMDLDSLSPRRGRKRKPVLYAESEEEEEGETPQRSWAGKRRKSSQAEEQ